MTGLVLERLASTFAGSEVDLLLSLLRVLVTTAQRHRCAFSWRRRSATGSRSRDDGAQRSARRHRWAVLRRRSLHCNSVPLLDSMQLDSTQLNLPACCA